MRPAIITVAITGSVPRRKDNSALPVTPAEQIKSTHEAFEKSNRNCGRLFGPRRCGVELEHSWRA